jgi:hypothetical protein
VSEDRWLGSEVQIFTVSLNGANIYLHRSRVRLSRKGTNEATSETRSYRLFGKKQVYMTGKTNKPRPKLRKAPQPPLSYPGATPDSDRARKPPLAELAATDQELNPGDRVEGLGHFGKATGEFGTVEQSNEDDAIVKWGDDGRMRIHQPSLKKV